jgi:protein kinase-like protein
MCTSDLGRDGYPIGKAIVLARQRNPLRPPLPPYNHSTLAPTPGTRLGPYEVTAQIGVGGMGEVYKASDTNLKRAVAINVLPAAVSNDPERLARCREAEVLAALNRPNIAQIHGLEKSDSTTALVMEFVEGPTLADRIARGAIPTDEALPIAKQITEAFAAPRTGHNNDRRGRNYGPDSTQDPESGRRGDGDGRSAGRGCPAGWAKRSCHVLLRKRLGSHPL